MARTSENLGLILSPTIVRRGGIELAGCIAAVALAAIFTGCNHAPAQAIPPPDPIPQIGINGLMTCNYANGVLSSCALNSGATLDDLANSLLHGTAVTNE